MVGYVWSLLIKARPRKNIFVGSHFVVWVLMADMVWHSRWGRLALIAVFLHNIIPGNNTNKCNHLPKIYCMKRRLPLAAGAADFV